MIKKVFFSVKKCFERIKWYHLIVMILTVCMLIAVLVLGIVLHLGSHSLPDQLMSQRWSKENDAAQVSCFYSEEAYLTEDNILEMRYLLEKELQEQAIVPKTETARLFIDAYSAEGTITIQSAKKSIEANAIGIGGEFFMFHPVELVSGMYFSGNDIMQDAVLLDEEAAWQLFGSNDIAGQTVLIGGTPYRVAGVYQREQGDLETMAGSKDTTVYVSYSTLSTYDYSPITAYEIVLPNPVEGFALELMTKHCMSSESERKIIENSARFSYVSLYHVWKERASRSMKTDSIALPFWENLARVKEEQMMEVALWQVVMAVILLIYWGIYGMIFIIRHKPTMKTFIKLWDIISEKTRILFSKIKRKKKNI